jgi:hypothetical protein
MARFVAHGLTVTSCVETAEGLVPVDGLPEADRAALGGRISDALAEIVAREAEKECASDR